jgi:Putative metal-binding motif
MVLLTRIAAAAAFALSCLLAACGAKTGLDTPPRCTRDEECPEPAGFCGAVPQCAFGVCRLAEPRACVDGTLCTVDGCDDTARMCTTVLRDRDGDGFSDASCGGIDCADLDPLVSPARTELCTDGRDNDCDGLADCSDSDCASDRSCLLCLMELCGNGSDDDCDGNVDCLDEDCASDPLCCAATELSCEDARDNDCDGQIDCLDGDCVASPTCCEPRAESCNGADDDCDGAIDDGVRCYYVDDVLIAPVEISTCPAEWYSYGDPESASANPVPDVRVSGSVVVAVVNGPASCGGAAVAVIADETNDGSGGALNAAFTLTPRPASGLLVSDDGDECRYDAATGTGTCGWEWQPCCTDGALFGLFPGDFCATITLDTPSGVADVQVRDGVGRTVPASFGRPIVICARTTPARS